MESFDFTIQFQGKTCQVHASALKELRPDGLPKYYQVLIDKYYFGDIFCDGTQWRVHSNKDQPQELIDIIGDMIFRFTQ
jgi:hypothetical protein